ncbi:MAG: V-type ATPase subunit [Lachnospiraceae bacterium]|nr:V-type ATPase subunit [Lachnospiraceae bacterium]
MGNLFAYSGLTTKVKAMRSHLITDSQYQEMAALDSVTASVDYLKKLPSYSHIFAGTEAGELHRAAIEELLLQSKYRDFSKLYRFSNLSQRKFLDLYFMHYEIAILKRCIRSVMGHKALDLDLSQFRDFFERHSKLDLIKLSASSNLAEFTANLAGSPYYGLLIHLNSQENLTMFDYEMNLDLIYFKTMWKVISKALKKKEKAALTECFGDRLDLLNIQWIYRCLKFYHMTPSEICALLIPIQHHLKRDEILKLAGCGSLEEFFTVLGSTWYGNPGLAKVSAQPNPEELYETILNRIHRMTAQKEPYSIASINSYLYFKELEIHRVIKMIESIRYGLDQRQILATVMNTN